jgi:DNA-directed RNA polymerase subunit RPC12/RpoP
MICDKCGANAIVDDSYMDIRVYKCWVCGNRIYVDYPRRIGSLICMRCGDDMEGENEFNLCPKCLVLLKMGKTRMKKRTYGESDCVCGIHFVRKSPTQVFCSSECKKKAHIAPRPWTSGPSLHVSP